MTAARPEAGAGRILKGVLFKFLGDNCPQQAAALSFYTFFSLPPLIFLLLTVTGALVDTAVMQARLQHEAAGLIGPAAGEQVGAIIETAAELRQGAGLAALVGLGALLFGATAAFAQLQASLNHVFRVQPDPTRGDIRNFLLKRLLSFAMILTLAFLLLVSLVLAALLTAVGDAVQRALPGQVSGVLLAGVHEVVAVLVVAVLFALMYRVLPDAEVDWRDVRVGAAVTAILFSAGRFAIGVWLGRTDPGSAYGAAGSLALVMIWVYYSSMIVLGGAVFTWVWADSRGRAVHPEPGAAEVVVEKRRLNPD